MRWGCLSLVIPFCTPVCALAAGHDYPALGHIPGYHITDYSERSFDSASFEPEPGQKVSVNGHKISIEYFADDNANHASFMEIYLNYLSVLNALKADIIHKPADMNADKQSLLARFYRNGSPVYVDIQAVRWNSDGEKYSLLIVEQKDFQPSIVTSPAQ
nr:hypothetical protein [uncultured Rhodopila sp.]